MAASALAVVPMIVFIIFRERFGRFDHHDGYQGLMQLGRPPKSQSPSKAELPPAYPLDGMAGGVCRVCVTKKLQLDLPHTFRYAAADGCGAAAMGKVDKKAGTATSSALIFFVNSI